MNRIKLFYFLIAILWLLPMCLLGQSPLIDPNWQIDTAQSDAFKPTSGSGSQNGINTSKWNLMYYAENIGSGIQADDWGGSTAFNTNYDSARTISGNGYLMLKVDSTLNSSSGSWTCTAACSPQPGTAGYCNFNAGGISSVNQYSYGYFEMNAKLPGYSSVTGDTGYGAKFWPAFWMANVTTGTHYEIDMMDECCCAYGEADTTGSGWSNGSNSCPCVSIVPGNCPYVSKVPLCNGFHKYAVEWNTNRIAFYRDDTVWHTDIINPAITWLPMTVIIDLQLSCYCTFDQNTFHYNVNKKRFQFMQVDYFNYYVLNHDCSTNKIFTSNSQITKPYYSFAVENSITFGSSGSSINLGSCTPPTGKQFVFRAVDHFEIPAGNTFTVPSGTLLMLVPTQCN